jgi:hypothetical protein
MKPYWTAALLLGGLITAWSGAAAQSPNTLDFTPSTWKAERPC